MTAPYDARAALVVVDVQNDFADPAGSLAVTGGPQVVEVATAQAALARDAGALVVCTQDWHPPDTPHFAKDGGSWPVHCVAGSWGAELHPALVAPGERVRKGAGGQDGYSGFTARDPVSGVDEPTALDAVLRAAGVERLVVLGLATDYCVLQTVLDGLRLGYVTTVLRAGVRPVELREGDGERALAVMTAAGAELG